MPALAAGPYLEAADVFGSPAYTLARATRAPDVFRAEADRVLFEALRVGVTLGPAPSTPPPCRRVTAGDRAPVVAGEVRFVAETPGTEVRLRRFSDDAPLAPIAVTSDTHPVVRIDLPRDAADLPWVVEISGAGVLCATPSAG